MSENEIKTKLFYIMSKKEVKAQLQEIIKDAQGPDGACSWVAFWDLVNLVKEIIGEENE